MDVSFFYFKLNNKKWIFEWMHNRYNIKILIFYSVNNSRNIKTQETRSSTDSVDIPARAIEKEIIFKRNEEQISRIKRPWKWKCTVTMQIHSCSF
jgi:hypothetical protein